MREGCRKRGVRRVTSGGAACIGSRWAVIVFALVVVGCEPTVNQETHTSFGNAWSVMCVGWADLVDCRCFLSFVFLGDARRLELSPCNTHP